MDGIFIINKEENCTSHDIVYKIKKEFNEKVGHTGTLDPMATGVLPILIGKGTLCSKYLINHDKIYETVIQLGQKTDTADIEGKIIEEKNVEESCFNKEYIEKVLKTFLGEQEQVPPIYSAIKVKGKKLYEYARSEKEVVLPKRNVTIYSLSLLEYDMKKQEFTFKALVSKGTYIRSLISDIGNCLGIPCTMKKLVRTKSGKFNIQDSVKINDKFKVIPIRESLDFPIYQVNDLDLLKKVKNGNLVSLKKNLEPVILFVDSNQQEIAIYKKLTIHDYKAFKVF